MQCGCIVAYHPITTMAETLKLEEDEIELVLRVIDNGIDIHMSDMTRKRMWSMFSTTSQELLFINGLRRPGSPLVSHF
jgi:hypothetical protein